MEPTYKANNLHDLIIEVKQNGMDITTEGIVRMQDILGNATEEEFTRLAEGGEKDCYGNAKHGWIQSTLFHIVFRCWDLERAVREYNRYVTRYPAQLEEAQGKLRQEMREHTETKAALKENALGWHREQQAAKALMAEKNGLANEVIRLKAHLYDLMTAGA